MRRAITAIGATVVGLVFLLGYKSGGPQGRSSIAAPPPTTDTTSGDGSGSGASGAEPLVPSTTLPGRAPTTPASVPSTAPTPTQAPAQGGVRTIKGSVVPNEYGDVQVQVTVTGTQITDVKALLLPSDRARSRQISRYAAPILRSEVLQAQNAQVDTVSGATYTSDGYAQSLQAALDQLRP